MTTAVNASPGAVEPARRRAGLVHFAVAGGLLLIGMVGSNVLLYGGYLVKAPVPCPKDVRTEKHRLTSFPATLPPPESSLPAAYVLVGDGELDRQEPDRIKPVFDGKPDGLVEAREDDLETLGTLGNDRNWYYFSTYRDLRSDPRRPRYIRLDVTYYTGLLEAVPHVPERCIVAGGGTILHDLNGSIPTNLEGLPDEWKHWNGAEMYRTAFEVTQKNGLTTQGAQYHLFSANGRPTASWKQVRLAMGSLWIKYAYFAKIQVAPFGAENSLEAADEACRDFLKAALPSILKNLPTAADVETLEAADR